MSACTKSGRWANSGLTLAIRSKTLYLLMKRWRDDTRQVREPRPKRYLSFNDLADHLFYIGNRWVEGGFSRLTLPVEQPFLTDLEAPRVLRRSLGREAAMAVLVANIG